MTTTSPSETTIISPKLLQYEHLPTYFDEQLFPLGIGGFALSKEEAIYLTKG